VCLHTIRAAVGRYRNAVTNTNSDVPGDKSSPDVQSLANSDANANPDCNTEADATCHTFARWRRVSRSDANAHAGADGRGPARLLESLRDAEPDTNGETGANTASYSDCFGARVAHNELPPPKVWRNG
jgi:hypothetical protein